MLEIVGDIWEARDRGAVVCVTTCGTIKKDGSLVMGKGVAGEAAARFPGLPMALGKMVAARGNHCFVMRPPQGQVIITFPTKHDYWEQSDRKLIRRSAVELALIAFRREFDTIILPRPGCGLGGLDWREVEIIIAPILNGKVMIVTSPPPAGPGLDGQRD